MSEYRPFDQAEKLGPKPWKMADPAVIAWEQAHGHDPRVKCLPEFGCLVIETALLAEIEAQREILAAQKGVIERVTQARDGFEAALGTCSDQLTECGATISDWVRHQDAGLEAAHADSIAVAAAEAALDPTGGER